MLDAITVNYMAIYLRLPTQAFIDFAAEKREKPKAESAPDDNAHGFNSTRSIEIGLIRACDMNEFGAQLTAASNECIFICSYTRINSTAREFRPVPATTLSLEVASPSGIWVGCEDV
ncbi:hypothetical protein MJO28_002736 [Puccinia striiformis f. sp. tritici]|uniref:Uncharacterized protein n=1 Tax=Puccinia striiformis f. sp. tritici TaxID=168172 RepID=A0ACC0EQR1_9BASI|nr:hypothetical protein Pst134EA_005300 [Puccinia striiformis f. sp. tritici]KAH9471400.1 hypothetical protein Pst134EA_005300 [Puccinia striiformis f. sp. tritici]KAI7958945.1 hypothetical protein MJO28_002736 [Puccinia striiformis f. sp. tritici]KAI7964707.1 hypothetical protein MJO29_002805 [Puccinia striiformis f. sp. tritici]